MSIQALTAPWSVPMGWAPVQPLGAPAALVPASGASYFSRQGAVPAQHFATDQDKQTLQPLLQAWIAQQTGQSVQSIDLQTSGQTPMDWGVVYDPQAQWLGQPVVWGAQGVAHMADGQSLGFSLQLQMPLNYLGGEIQAADMADAQLLAFNGLPGSFGAAPWAINPNPVDGTAALADLASSYDYDNLAASTASPSYLLANGSVVGAHGDWVA